MLALQDLLYGVRKLQHLDPSASNAPEGHMLFKAISAESQAGPAGNLELTCFASDNASQERHELSPAIVEQDLTSAANLETPNAETLSDMLDENVPYISPYNLEERAKKLKNPSAPQYPCICDPECVCTPLCASDPSKNCLCEENGLFVRVTEGMDIDDLNVPDLIRRRRSDSELSSAASELGSGLFSVDDVTTDCQAFFIQNIDIDIANQESQQKSIFEQNFEFGGRADAQGLRGTMLDSARESLYGVPSDKYGSFGYKISTGPHRKSPFSQQYTAPPKAASKRSTVKRIFGMEGILG